MTIISKIISHIKAHLVYKRLLDSLFTYEGATATYMYYVVNIENIKGNSSLEKLYKILNYLMDLSIRCSDNKNSREAILMINDMLSKACARYRFYFIEKELEKFK